jgi:hypothetical protein
LNYFSKILKNALSGLKAGYPLSKAAQSRLKQFPGFSVFLQQ